MTESSESKVRNRVNIASGTPWEPLRGFSRAVIVDDRLFISGTTALVGSGEVVGLGKPYEQARFIFERIRKILTQNGFQLSDIVRTRLFITNMGHYEEIAQAHREVFDTIRPASSILQVVKLADPRMLVEIEADAIRGAAPLSSVRLSEGLEEGRVQDT